MLTSFLKPYLVMYSYSQYIYFQIYFIIKVSSGLRTFETYVIDLNMLQKYFILFFYVNGLVINTFLNKKT